MPVGEFKQLQDSQSLFESKMEVWTKLDTWNEQVYAWKSVDFKTLDVDEMVKEVSVHFKDVHKMSKRVGPTACPIPSSTCSKSPSRTSKCVPVMNWACGPDG